MTDNRTNGPTPEQVEAAAKEFERVWDENIDSFDPEQHDAMSYIKTAMRAALVAAQGAGVAPQELCPQPCEHLSAEDAREGRDCREHPCTCPTASSSDREKLIEEARAVAVAKSLYAHTSVAHLLTRLADALVAAQGAAPQASKKNCGPCRRGQHGCCDGNEYLRCECSHGAAPVLPSSGVDEVWRGRIVTASFENGVSRVDCGLEDCECPEHEQPPIPAGTYVTVRLDKDERIGLTDVEIRVLTGRGQGGEGE